jgi:molecular chaperone GrpE
MKDGKKHLKLNKSNKYQNQLQQKIEELQGKLIEVQEREKRSLADYQNLQRRTQQERGHVAKFANRELIQSLLPILENLETATQQIKNKGLDMILDQLKQVLQQYGVEEINALGKEFDLETMEAVETNGEGNFVTEVIKKGYKLKGEVIQHAQVILGKK